MFITWFQVGCKAIIAADEFKGHDYYATLFHLIPELARCKDGFVESHRYDVFVYDRLFKNQALLLAIVKHSQKLYIRIHMLNV